MSAVPVTIARTRPPDRGPIVATSKVTVVADLDDVLESVECSCSGSDDNPH